MSTPIILLFGQSNSVGEGAVSGVNNFSALGIDQPFPAVQYQEQCASAPGDPIVWDTVRGPVDLQPRPSTGGMGIEISLGRRLVQVYGINHNLAKIAIVSSDLSLHWKNPAYPTTPPSLENQLLTYMNTVETNLNGVIVGGVWQQGEADAGSAGNAVYDTNLISLFSDLRAVRPNMWFVVVQLNWQAGGGFNGVVRAKEAAVVAGVKGVRMVSGDDFIPLNGAHYTSQGCYDLGNRVGDAVAEIMLGQRSFGGRLPRGYLS